MDPKGDPDLFKRFLLAAIRAGRLDDVMVLHFGCPKESVKYNPVSSFQAISEVAGRISSKLPSEGASQAFSDFAWRFINIAATAMHRIGESITIASIKKHVKSFDELLVEYIRFFLDMTKEEFEKEMSATTYDMNMIEKYLQSKSDYTIKAVTFLNEATDSNGNKIEKDEILTDILQAYSYDKTYYDKITASLLPFLDKLSALNDITSSPDVNARTLNLEDAIQNKKLVYVALDTLSNEEVGKAFGSMLFGDLVSAAGKFYKSQDKFNKVLVHADEFNDMIGVDFLPLINKAGGAGVIINSYTQTDADIENGFGGNSASVKAAVIKGNYRTIGIMRVGMIETANFLTERLAEVNVKYSVKSSTYNDSTAKERGATASTSDSIQTDKVSLVESSAIMSQPTGQAFLSKNGNNLFHVRFPLIKDNLGETIGHIEKGRLKSIIRDVNNQKFKLLEKDSLGTKHGSKENKKLLSIKGGDL
jgi:conjugative coupling factor TraD (SXT/TOL subfamily)